MPAPRRSRWMIVCHLLFFFILISNFLAHAQVQTQTNLTSEVNPPRGHRTAVTEDLSNLSKKNVLILYDYTYETASSIIMDPIFVKGFMAAGLGAFNLHFEFMYHEKNPDQVHRQEFTQYIGLKFEKRPIDLIIASHPAAEGGS